MGTVVDFRVETGAIGLDAARRAVEAACAVLHQADSTFSTWAPQSPMSRYRRGELGSAPPGIAEVLALCEQARQMSGGWFDPWAMPGGVDPTGLVKGWAAERALGVLTGAGVTAAMVNAGGDIAAACDGARPWRIGIRHPWIPSALACLVEVRRAVATSGTYERGLHLVVPEGLAGHRRRGVAGVSATVTGPRLTFADALATALCVGGPEVLGLIETAGYEGYLILGDGEEVSTASFPFAARRESPAPAG